MDDLSCVLAWSLPYLSGGERRRALATTMALHVLGWLAGSEVGRKRQRRWLHAMRGWKTAQLDAVRAAAVASRDIAPVNEVATAALRAALCVATNAGVRPTFSDDGARSGYVRDNLKKRSWAVPALLLLPSSAGDDGSAAMARCRQRLLLQRRSLRVASIGGGPGFDGVGLGLLAERLRWRGELLLHVFDVHGGEWADAVGTLHGCMRRRAWWAGGGEEEDEEEVEGGGGGGGGGGAAAAAAAGVAAAQQEQQRGRLDMRVGYCDVLQPLSASPELEQAVLRGATAPPPTAPVAPPTPAAAAAAAAATASAAAAATTTAAAAPTSTAAGGGTDPQSGGRRRGGYAGLGAGFDLYLFQYVLVENAEALRAGGMPFLRDLFAAAAAGSVFLFTDSTHRLWPEIAALAGEGFDASAPRLSSQEKCHFALLLEKRALSAPPRAGGSGGGGNSSDFQHMCRRFEDHKLAHEARAAHAGTHEERQSVAKKARIDRVTSRAAAGGAAVRAHLPKCEYAFDDNEAPAPEAEAGGGAEAAAGQSGAL